MSPLDDNMDSRPVPDPTILTTSQLLREIANVKDYLILETNRRSDVNQERLQSVETQFALIERQRVEQKADTEKAVQAALSAAKEAVKEQTAASDKSITKSETATSEQLKQLTSTFNTAIQGITSIIEDVKERIGKMESRREGSESQLARHGSSSDRMISMVAVIISLISAVAFIVYAVSISHP